MSTADLSSLPSAAAAAEAAAAARRAYDDTVVFLVYPGAITSYYINGRVVHAPWHKLLGRRRHPFGHYRDTAPQPLGAAYFTAEQLGFNNAELLPIAREREEWEITHLTEPTPWNWRVPRALRERIARVNMAIVGSMAAWERRRTALVAWSRANPRA